MTMKTQRFTHESVKALPRNVFVIVLRFQTEGGWRYPLIKSKLLLFQINTTLGNRSYQVIIIAFWLGLVVAI